MRSLSHFALESRAGIRGVLFDIDDTLTTHGHLTADAYAAVERLKQAGLIVVPITGRPAGWCDHIARMWPVDGVVGENGAFYFYLDRADKKLKQRFIKGEDERKQDRERLAAIARKILAAVPGCALASDQHYREADIAIDFCEDVPPLSRADVDRIHTLMEAEGLTAKISSIHVNGWFGAYDKLSTTRRLFSEVLGIDLEQSKQQFVFVGDSPNDQPMFGYFPHSIGVANVSDFVDRLVTPPSYVTAGRCGAGFIELADALIAARH